MSTSVQCPSCRKMEQLTLEQLTADKHKCGYCGYVVIKQSQDKNLFESASKTKILKG